MVIPSRPCHPLDWTSRSFRRDGWKWNARTLADRHSTTPSWAGTARGTTSSYSWSTRWCRRSCTWQRRNCTSSSTIGALGARHCLSFVGTLKGGYVRNIPLPRAPRIQSANHVTSKKQVTIGSQDTCYLQVPCVLTWSDLTRLLVGWGRTIHPFSPIWLMWIAH